MQPVLEKVPRHEMSGSGALPLDPAGLGCGFLGDEVMVLWDESVLLLGFSEVGIDIHGEDACPRRPHWRLHLTVMAWRVTQVPGSLPAVLHAAADQRTTSSHLAFRTPLRT